MKSIILFDQLRTLAYQYGLTIHELNYEEIVIKTRLFYVHRNFIADIEKILDHYNDNAIYSRKYTYNIIGNKNKLTLIFKPL